MRSIPRVISLALFPLALALALAACGGEDDAEPDAPARCATCGMLVAPDDGWRAGAEGLSFDAPKCLMRHRLQEGAIEAPWVIEYYSQERRDAADMLYVVGTDLESGMGPDLVPVEGREAAERKMRDHGGERIIGWGEIDLALLDGL